MPALCHSSGFGWSLRACSTVCSVSARLRCPAASSAAWEAASARMCASAAWAATAPVLTPSAGPSRSASPSRRWRMRLPPGVDPVLHAFALLIRVCVQCVLCGSGLGVLRSSEFAMLSVLRVLCLSALGWALLGFCVFVWRWRTGWWRAACGLCSGCRCGCVGVEQCCGAGGWECGGSCNKSRVSGLCLAFA